MNYSQIVTWTAFAILAMFYYCIIIDVDTDTDTWWLLVLYFKGFTSISYSNGFLQYITVSQRMYSRKSLSEKAPTWVNDLDTVVKYQQS